MRKVPSISGYVEDGNFNVNVTACVLYSPLRPTGSCFLLSKSMVFLKKLVTHAFEGFVHLYTLLSRISITTPLFVLLLIQKLHEEELHYDCLGES